MNIDSKNYIRFETNCLTGFTKYFWDGDLLFDDEIHDFAYFSENKIGEKIKDMCLDCLINSAYFLSSFGIKKILTLSENGKVVCFSEKNNNSNNRYIYVNSKKIFSDTEKYSMFRFDGNNLSCDREQDWIDRFQYMDQIYCSLGKNEYKDISVVIYNVLSEDRKEFTVQTTNNSLTIKNKTSTMYEERNSYENCYSQHFSGKKLVVSKSLKPKANHDELFLEPTAGKSIYDFEIKKMSHTLLSNMI